MSGLGTIEYQFSNHIEESPEFWNHHTSGHTQYQLKQNLGWVGWRHWCFSTSSQLILTCSQVWALVLWNHTSDFLSCKGNLALRHAGRFQEREKKGGAQEELGDVAGAVRPCWDGFSTACLNSRLFFDLKVRYLHWLRWLMSR